MSKFEGDFYWKFSKWSFYCILSQCIPPYTLYIRPLHLWPLLPSDSPCVTWFISAIFNWGTYSSSVDITDFGGGHNTILLLWKKWKHSSVSFIGTRMANSGEKLQCRDQYMVRLFLCARYIHSCCQHSSCLFVLFLSLIYFCIKLTWWYQRKMTDMSWPLDKGTRAADRTSIGNASRNQLEIAGLYHCVVANCMAIRSSPIYTAAVTTISQFSANLRWKLAVFVD